MACRTLPPTSGRGTEEPVPRAVLSVSRKAAGNRGGEQGLRPAASDAGPRPRVWRRRGERAVALAVLGGASLVEEVGLEGGGQRQRVDLTQPLLSQGQAHGAAAEVHERQGLSWGREREREPG